MSEAEFRDWMHRLTKRYPGISGVCVTGSRVLNTGKTRTKRSCSPVRWRRRRR